MTDIATLVADNIHIWTGAIQRKSNAGRGGGKRISLYGIERLRALILDLAVRGKLVPQDAADEPASELLKKIKNEKSRLVASGQAKPGKPLVVPSEWPFEIPNTWSWSQLGNATNYGQIDKADPGSVSPETWVLELEDVEKSTSHLLERVRCAERPFQSQKNAFQIGDVIYGKLRPYLDKVIVADEPGVCTTEMIPMRGYAGVRPDYIRLFLKSPFFIALATDAAHGMNLPRLATGKAREAPFALPPLAEQRRIVAKVDELMALCDALERESADAMAAHQTLVEALLATLVNSADAADLARQWARLESHFDTLFTTDASVDALKQTILDLAVRGKLVEQDAEDEHAEKMLSLIAPNKVKGSKPGKTPKFTVCPITKAEVPFGIPDAWAWARFSQVAKIRAELVQSLDFPDAIQIAPDVIEKGSGRLLSIRTVAEAGVRGPNSRFYKGQIIYSKIRPSLSKAVIAEFDGLCSADMYPLDARIDANFLLRLILSEPFLQQVRVAENRVKMPKLNKESLNAFAVPVPPLAEQRRIVAKVDALMALCDALKARLADAAQTQRHLADAIAERAAA